MSNFQSVFKRIEKKYVIDEKTYQTLTKLLEEYMQPDEYGKSTISNIYYDTPEHRLIRTSIEGPIYKEKFRVRSYGTPSDSSTVFVEVKKKYKGVVYKRRVDMTLKQSRDFIEKGICPEKNPQIEKELRYFLSFYKNIAPAMFISYDRIAMFAKDNPDLRITFDSHIIYRDEQKELNSGVWGKELLPPGTRIMEIKIPGVMPLWLSHMLDSMKIYPSSYSKYGTAYTNEVTEKSKKGKVTDCA